MRGEIGLLSIEVNCSLWRKPPVDIWGIAIFLTFGLVSYLETEQGAWVKYIFSELYQHPDPLLTVLNLFSLSSLVCLSTWIVGNKHAKFLASPRHIQKPSCFFSKQNSASYIILIRDQFWLCLLMSKRHSVKIFVLLWICWCVAV